MGGIGREMCSSASSRRLGLVVSILLMLRASDAQVPSDTLGPEGRGLQILQTQLMGDEQNSDIGARREQPSVAQVSAAKSESSNLHKEQLSKATNTQTSDGILELSGSQTTEGAPVTIDLDTMMADSEVKAKCELRDLEIEQAAKTKYRNARKHLRQQYRDCRKRLRKTGHYQDCKKQYRDECASDGAKPSFHETHQK